MDPQTKTRRILKECGVFHDGGHFIYSSGLHGDFYINKDALYSHPLKLDDISVMMTDNALKAYIDFDTVLSPTIGGVVLGQAIAYNVSLYKQQEVNFAYAEKSPTDPHTRIIRRGYQKSIKNKRVLLVDDIVTTGNTLVAMAQAVILLGGIVVGSVVICDRGDVRRLKYVVAVRDGGEDKISIPLVENEINIVPLVELDLKTFDAATCPFCKAGRPIDKNLGEGLAVSDAL